MTGPSPEALAIALRMANERADRWQQRYNDMKAEVARLNSLLEAKQ